MKPCLSTTITLLLITVSSLAQIRDVEPVKKKDTLFGGWWMGMDATERPMLIAPVLQYPAKKKSIQPKETICFDTRFRVLGEIAGELINTCFLVNSESGISGSFSVYGNQRKCEFDIDDPAFQFFLTTKKGIAFRYFNREERAAANQPTVIKHYLITGNTHRNQLDEVAEQKILNLKEDSYREFLDGRVKARHYRTSDTKSDLYLVGDNFPKQMIIIDHLGAYGLGYLKTNAGYYLVLGHERGSQFNMAVREIEKMGNEGLCLATAIFTTMEEEKIPEVLEANSERERKLEEKLEKDLRSTKPCAAKKVEWTQFKLEAARKEQEILGKLKNEKFKATSEADMYKLAALYNPVIPYAIERRELEHKLCVLEEDLSNERVSNKQMAETMRRKQCWENKISVYKHLEDTWHEIEMKYKTDKPQLMKAMAEFHRDELVPGLRKTKCN